MERNKYAQGLKPGDWCKSCPIMRIDIDQKDSEGHVVGFKREPCNTMRIEYETSGTVDSRCGAIQQAQYNSENGILPSL